MRWNSHVPVEGEERTVKKYAWFPKQIDDTVVWLEPYISHQRYESWIPDAYCRAWGWVEKKACLYEG